MLIFEAGLAESFIDIHPNIYHGELAYMRHAPIRAVSPIDQSH